MGFGQDYQKQGVEEFYLNMIEPYHNPHEAEIVKLVQRYCDPSKKYLDLAAGNGLVTKALIEIGCENVEGLEPFIPIQYLENTGKNCSLLNFQDLSNGLFTKKFDVIICSYALHLLGLSFLPTFLYQLTHIADTLIILTPHKRPVIEDFWELVEEDRLNKTKLKMYKKTI